MPKPLPSSRRTWVAAWAVLCVAGTAATAALNASPAPGPRPGTSHEPVSAECAAYIAAVERELAKAAERTGEEGGVLAFTRVRTGAEDCDDELRDHLDGYR
ncbi:hypothetical protein [Streptomyces sp. JB150]|uniref:hypothetical protein n=1 Tax=Streptomyces sp. JB150 TaxID=2714844 RepID=UPI00140C1B32|nr:hypothetical protein [Streptomyces sp. JB150]QIJ60639.1 hypothetical protein G7Z13_00230 [Streptomyces sp. JB150]